MCYPHSRTILKKSLQIFLFNGTNCLKTDLINIEAPAFTLIVFENRIVIEPFPLFVFNTFFSLHYELKTFIVIKFKLEVFQAKSKLLFPECLHIYFLEYFLKDSVNSLFVFQLPKCLKLAVWNKVSRRFFFTKFIDLIYERQCSVASFLNTKTKNANSSRVFLIDMSFTTTSAFDSTNTFIV